MASLAMGRFCFFAHATVVSNLFTYGIGDMTPNQPEMPMTEASDILPAKEADRITDLPGLNYDPGFDQFSGYLTVDEKRQRKIFYWYVESQSNPETDPVVFWTNGGPGCSGLLAFGTEHGPFFISESGELSPNPFSWNIAANFLYVEQPAGTGFSYSEHHKDYVTGDGKAAIDNYKLILEFFERFPERLSNDFYISSESYGGHYMPQLTNEILSKNTNGKINFKGMMVGNPYVDPFTNWLTMYQEWYHHGLVPMPLYRSFLDKCQNPKTYLHTECQSVVEQLYMVRGKGINEYALDYPMCLEDRREVYAQSQASNPHDSEKDTTSSMGGRDLATSSIYMSAQQASLWNQVVPDLPPSHLPQPPFLPSEDWYRPCAELHLENYLNDEDVVRALHVNPDTLPWKACNHRLEYSRKDYYASEVELYKDLLRAMDSDVDLRMLVFSGDDDSVCSLASTQAWIWDLGFHAKEDSMWVPWKVHNQTAGYVTHFDLKNTKSSFTFATVHGAGHEVPAYRPMEALELFRLYLDGEW